MKALAVVAVLSAVALPAFALSPVLDKPIQLVDANSKIVGRQFPLLGGSGSGVQLILNHHPRFVVPLVPQQLAGGIASPTKLDFRSDFVYYTSLDCTGQAYMANLAMGTLYGVVLIAPSGMVTLFPPASDELMQINIGSTRGGGGCSPNSGPLLVLPADRPIDITAKYTRPFTFK